MKKSIIISFFLLLLTSNCYSQPTINYENSPLEISDSTGSIVTFPYKVKVPTSGITDNGDGTTSLNFLSSGVSTTGMPYTNPDSGVYFHSVDSTTLQLYVANTLVHNWVVTPTVNYLLLQDGFHLLQEDGSSHIIL